MKRTTTRILLGFAAVAGITVGGAGPLLQPSSAPFSSWGTVTHAAPASVVRSAAGQAPADILSAVDTFRADLGGANNGAGPPAATGRREIGWDGVPAQFSAPNFMPATLFQNRGVIFSTPGVGVQVSANAGVAPIEFDTINPTYSGLFEVFSAQKLFTAVDSTIVDVRFFVPGTSTPALSKGFGSVFTDVDRANTTSIEYYDVNNQSLGRFFVPNIAGNETLSFLGVSFDAAVVSWVRITSGTTGPSPRVNETAATDLVVMDDFIYGEPQAAPAGPRGR